MIIECNQFDRNIYIYMKEEIKRNNIVKQYKNVYVTIIIYDYIAKEYIKKYNQKWSEIPDHPYRILIIGGSGSGKTNAVLNLINHKPDIDKILSYAKDPYEAKQQILINKRESTVLKYFNDSKAFIEYSNDMEDIYKNIEEHNPNIKRQMLNAFGNMIADMLSDKKLNSIVTGLFIS